MMKHFKLLLLSAVLVNLAHAPYGSGQEQTSGTTSTILSNQEIGRTSFFHSLSIITELEKDNGKITITQDKIKSLNRSLSCTHPSGWAALTIEFLKTNGYATEEDVKRLKQTSSVAEKWSEVQRAMILSLLKGNESQDRLKTTTDALVKALSVGKDAECLSLLTRFIYAFKASKTEGIDSLLKYAPKKENGTVCTINRNQVPGIFLELNTVEKHSNNSAALLMLFQMYTAVKAEQTTGILLKAVWIGAVGATTMAFGGALFAALYHGFRLGDVPQFNFYNTLHECGQYVCPSRYNL